MTDSRFLRACSRQPTDTTPIWLMRQAGRYLPEYRTLRERYDLLTICRTPELAAEVTLQPLRRFPLDAAIVFADILYPLLAIGIDVAFGAGEGPIVTTAAVSQEAIQRWPEPDEARLQPVAETIRLVRGELPSSVAVLGFAGAPFTLASYVLEGGSSRHYLRTKRLLAEQPETWAALLDRLTDLTIRYLALQVAAGADAIQLFDSWVGALDPETYRCAVLPWTQRVVGAIQRLGVPVIVFSTGTAGYLDLVSETGADVISVDWRIALDRAWAMIGERAVQGNLDPAFLLAPRTVLRAAALSVLERAGGRPGHIFNLGHGVLPETPPDAVAYLVDLVHRASGQSI